MTLGLSLNVSEVGSVKPQNRIVYANKQIRIERLTEISELVKLWITQRGERMDEYKQSINVISGPFLIFSKGERQIIQAIDGSATALNLNPHNDSLHGLSVAKTIIYEFNNKYEAIAVLNNGLIHYYNSLKLLKNTLETQTPVDSCRIDFFSGERITCIKYQNYALYVATTHGRIAKIAQIGGQLLIQCQNFADVQNNGKSARDLSAVSYQTNKGNINSVNKVAKSPKRRKTPFQDNFQDAKISDFYIQLNQHIQKQLNDDIIGQENRILGMKASNKYIFCLLEGQIIQYDLTSLKRMFTLNIKQKLEELNFNVVNKKNYKECAKPDKVIIRDFDVQDKFYYIMCDYLPHPQANKYFGVFIVKIEISTLNMQFFNVQARGMQQSARDIGSQFIIDDKYYNREPEQVKKHSKDDKMSFKTAVEILYRFISPDFFPISQLTTRQRMYMGRFGSGVLNILVSSQLFKASLSVIHDTRKLKTHFDVEGDSLERYIEWSIACNGVEACERLNRLPQFFLQLYSDICPALSSGKASLLAQLRCKPKKVTIGARLGALVFGSQRVGFYELKCQPLPLSGRRSERGTLLLSEKYRSHMRRTHFQAYKIVNCDLCDPSLARSSRKFRSGSLFLNIESEGLYLVQQFSQHWFHEVGNERRQATLLQNFASYLRNEEVGYIKQISKNDAESVKDAFEQINDIAKNIACRPLIDVQHDKRWFQEWGKGQRDVSSVCASKEELKTLRVANEQKLEELSYFVHFIKEIGYYDLDQRISRTCLGYFDALNGVSYVLDRLLANDMSEELCKAVQESLCAASGKDAATALSLTPLEEVLSNVGRHLDFKLFQHVFLGTEFVNGSADNITRSQQYNKDQNKLIANVVPDHLFSTFSELFAGYCERIVEERIQEAYVFDFVWARQNDQRIIDLDGIATFMDRHKPNQNGYGPKVLNLSAWCRLHGALFFFDYARFRSRGAELGNALCSIRDFENAGAKVLGRFRFYAEVLKYCTRLPTLTRTAAAQALRQGRLPLLNSAELQDNAETLTDRLAFYYQQHEQLISLSNPPVVPPSLSEAENLKFLQLLRKQLIEQSSDDIRENATVDYGVDFGASESGTTMTEVFSGKIGSFLVPVLNEPLLELFKQAQVEEELFACLDVSPSEFGRLLRESPEYDGLTWFWDVDIRE